MDSTAFVASIITVIQNGERVEEVLAEYRGGSGRARTHFKQLIENMEMLNYFLREIIGIFLGPENPIPPSATKILSICRMRGEILHAAVERQLSASSETIVKKIFTIHKYRIRGVKMAFDAYKESVDTLRDIAARSMTRGILQQQARLEIEILTVREMTERNMDYLQRLNYNILHTQSDEKESESERTALTRRQQFMHEIVSIPSTFPQAGETASTTQYHIEDPANLNYHESSFNERKFFLETQRLAAFQPDDTIFNAFLLPTKPNHQERVKVYSRCKLDTDSDINLIDSNLIYKHNFQHLILEIPEANRMPIKGFSSALWTPTQYISVEFSLPGSMKTRSGLFFLCLVVDFDLLICKNFFKEISEANLVEDKNHRMLTASAPLTADQLALQNLQQASQKSRNEALKKKQDKLNREERARKRLQPPVNPALSTGGRACTIAHDGAIMPPPMAGSSKVSLASVESRDAAVGNGAAPAVSGNVGGGSSTAAGG